MPFDAAAMASAKNRLRISPSRTISPRSHSFDICWQETEWNVAFDRICSEADLATLQWYAEEYATVDPFSSTRAEKAVTILDGYGAKLACCLQLHRCQVDDNTEVQVDVVSESSQSDSPIPVLWETLENLEAWPRYCRPRSVVILRTLPTRCCENYYASKPDGDPLMVLIVTTRPQSTADIPHRLVSRIVLRQSHRVGRDIRIAISRPGTYEALKRFVMRQSFDIVHFDVHGLSVDGRTKLAFLKPDDDGFRTHLVNASDVAQLLVEQKVSHVVLNACRSAFGSLTDGNIAATFVEVGCTSVTAMSYAITSASVEVFTEAFYEAMFSGVDVACAAAQARKALGNRIERRTKWGDQIRVLDNFIPVHYQSSGVGAFTFNAPVVARESSDDSAAWMEQESSLFGRENDILQLENNLLLSSNVGVLYGAMATGKTALLEFLSSWWTSTNLITDVAWIDVAEYDGFFDFHLALPELALQLLRDDDRADEVLEYIRTHRVLIVVDGLQSAKYPDYSGIRKQRAILKGLLRQVYDTQCFVVISSRNAEGWLDNLGGDGNCFTFSQKLEGLSISSGVQLIRERREIKQFTPSTERGEIPREINFLEHIVKLVEGNPLCLKILADDWMQSSMSAEEYYTDLLQGKNVDLDALIEDENGSTIWSQYQDLVSKILNPPIEEKLIRSFDLAMKARLGVQPLPSDMAGAISPTVFAFTWQVLAADELWTIMLLLALEMLANDTTSVHEYMRVAQPDFNADFAAQNLPYLKAVLVSGMIGTAYEASILQQPSTMDLIRMCQGLLDSMKGMDLISDIPLEASSLPAKHFVKIHPLLPILSRATEDYIESKTMLKPVFVAYKAYQMRSWPTEHMYWNAVWEEVKLEIGLDFTSFLAAALLGASLEPGPIWLETALIRFMQCLPKGCFRDPSRHNLLVSVWQKMLTRSEAAYTAMCDPASEEFNKAMNRSEVRFLDVTEGNTAQPETWIVFLRSIFALQFALASVPLTFDLSLDSEEKLRTKTTVVRIVSQSIRELEPLDLHPLFPKKKMLAAMRYAIEGQHADEGRSLEESWRIREAYIRQVTSESGIEDYPPQQNSWRNIPHHANSVSIPWAVYTNIRRQVNSLIAQEAYKEARDLLKGLLDFETNHSVNNVANKIRLLLLLAVVDRAQELWGDAIVNTNKALELRHSLAPDFPPLERARYESKLAKLYELACDNETTAHYVKLLLLRANTAAKAQDITTEIRCLKRLWRLKYTLHNDSPVFALFLIVRAAVAAYRINAANSSMIMERGKFWPSALSLNQGVTHLWLTGPVDSRPSTVAISFLCTMFGQIINLPICWQYTSGNLTDQDVEEASKEVEQRIFGETGTRTTHLYISHEYNWEPQRQLFEQLWIHGVSYLHGEIPHREGGEERWPSNPWTPCTMWGETRTGGLFGTNSIPVDYVLPTKVMLELAGYIVDDS